MKKIYDMVLENAAFYDAPMNELKLKLFASELQDLPTEGVAAAFANFRRQNGRRQLPMPADIREYIRSASPAGHPGVEEAWAIVPKSESDSVVWTKQIAEAFYACMSLIEEDPIAARMAFKEKYQQIMLTQSSTAPEWSASLGHSKLGRVSVLLEAVNKKRLLPQEARKLLPDTVFNDERVLKQLSISTGGQKILEQK